MVRTAAIVVAVALLGGCATPSTTLTVDAVGADGTVPILVTADRSGDGPFLVEGTPSTPESAVNSATVAMLNSGRDPRGHRLRFSTPRPVDGAAGALLAVASWAALDGGGFPADTSVIGGVLPNGAIVATPGLAAALRTAAEEGIRTVLIPSAAGTVRDGAGQPVDPVALGRSWGLDVRPVDSVGDAAAVLRDTTPPGPTSPPPLDADLVDLVTIATRQIMGQVAATLNDRPPETRRGLAESLRSARNALADGQPFVAYSTVTLAQQDDLMESAAKGVRRGSLDSVRRRLTREVRIRHRATVRELRHFASTPLRAAEQFPALADALTWATGTLALLGPLPDTIRRADSRRELAVVAGQSARAAYRVSTYLPLQVEAAERVGQASTTDPATIASVLAAYADLLAQAADANSVTVHGGSPAVAAPLLRRMDDQETVWRRWGPASGGQESTLVALAAALSYYVASSNALVAGALLDAGTGVARDDGFFSRQVALATRTNDTLALTLADDGWDPSYVVWGDDWGRTWAATTAAGADPATRTTGLTYQWYATVQGQMVQALTDVSGRG